MKINDLVKFLYAHRETCAVHLFSGNRHCSCGLLKAQTDYESVKDFTQDVAKMRKAQIEYFKTRSQQALKDARFWERKVDQELASLSKKEPATPTVTQNILIE